MCGRSPRVTVRASCGAAGAWPRCPVAWPDSGSAGTHRRSAQHSTAGEHVRTMNPYSAVFDAQKEYFASNVTRSYEWRVEQLDRMSRMVTENKAGFQQAIAADFKTARQEYDFETSTAIAEAEFQKSQLQAWMEPAEAPVPRALAATGHKAMIYREPYGVTLVIGPFNGPLTLLIRPAIAVLAAGNTCILKPSEALTATSALLSRLVPEYFDPRAVCVVAADREKGSQLLDLPFDFLFFTGSTRTGKGMGR